MASDDYHRGYVSFAHFLLYFFIVVVILGNNLGNSQVSVYRTIGPTLVLN